MKKVMLLLGVAMFLGLVSSPDFSYGSEPHGGALPSHSSEIVLMIPVGDDGVHYRGEGIEEMFPWGPAALAIGPDGTFWIADTAGHRLLHYDSSGESLGTIDIWGSVLGASDLEIDSSGDVLVLDRSTQVPKVVRFSPSGNLIDSYELPEGFRNEDGLTGIALGEDGDILAQVGGKAYRFAGPAGRVDPQEMPGYIRAGKVYRTQLSGLPVAEGSKGLITAGGLELDIAVEQKLGGVRFLDAAGDGTFFVVVDELAPGPRIVVDQTVRRYDASGRLSGVARVPLSERYTRVKHGLAVGPDGEVYYLLTKPDRAEVIRLQFVRSLEPILPSRPEVVAASAVVCETNPPDSPPYNGGKCEVPPDPEPKMSRGDFIHRAHAYLQFKYPYEDKHVLGTHCDATDGRGIPTWLLNAAERQKTQGMPYDWGGWDIINSYEPQWEQYGFEYKMTERNTTYQAGDVDTVNPKKDTDGDGDLDPYGIEACSAGVDCSGFVSRAWRTWGRCRTSDIECVSTQIALEEMMPGDILNKSVPGTNQGHVMLFRQYEGDAICVIESTADENYERVARKCYLWADISDYVPRRYNRIKNDGTFIPHFPQSFNGMDSYAFLVHAGTAHQHMLFNFMEKGWKTQYSRRLPDSDPGLFYYFAPTNSQMDGAVTVHGDGAAVVSEVRHDSGEIDADLGFVNSTYAAAGGGDYNVDHVGLTLFAPIINVAQSDTNSTLNLQNVTGYTASVKIKFYKRPPSTTITTKGPYTIKPFGTFRYHPGNAGVGSGAWSAVIESDKNLAVQVSEINSANGITRTYNAAKGGDESIKLFLPAMYKAYYGMTSGVIVQNLHGSTAANVYLTFRDRNGIITKDKYLLGNIPGRRALGLWLGNFAGLPSGWSGSVEVSNDKGVRLAAVCNNNLDGVGGYSYNAMSKAGKKIILPRARKGAWGNTGYTVLNRSGYIAVVTATYYNADDGSVTDSRTFEIASNGVQGFHQKNDTFLPEGWWGHIVLESNMTDRQIMAIMRLDRPDGVAGYNGFRPIP